MTSVNGAKSAIKYSISTSNSDDLNFKARRYCGKFLSIVSIVSVFL